MGQSIAQHSHQAQVSIASEIAQKKGQEIQVKASTPKLLNTEMV
jgi:hypothetical protein